MPPQNFSQFDEALSDGDAITVWTNTYGKAKIFATTMGHNNRTMADSVYLDLVTRGLLWAVGKLGPDGTPVAGYGPRATTP